MSPDEWQRAAYNDLLSVGAVLDRHGGCLSEDSELAVHARVIRGHVAALIDQLCIRIGAYRPGQQHWWQR